MEHQLKIWVLVWLACIVCWYRQFNFFVLWDRFMSCLCASVTPRIWRDLPIWHFLFTGGKSVCILRKLPMLEKKKTKKNRCIFPSSDSFILSHKVIQFIVFFLFFFLLRMQTYSLSLYTTGMYCCSSNAFNFCPGLFLSKADLSPLEWYHPFTTVLKRYCSDYTFFSFIFNSLLMICLLYTKLFTCSFKRKS